MKCDASQSSNSGWLGGSPCTPQSSSVLTRPTPKNWYHKRFTATRLVSGCAGSVSHIARPRRLGGAPLGIGGSAAGTLGETGSPGALYWPRLSTNVGRGGDISC